MVSTNILLTAAAVCFLFALAVPTVAITVGEDTAADDVVLKPTSQYASLNDNNELQLDLEALNDRAITTFDDIFSITVNDDAVERIWISNEVDGLEFYDGTNPTAEITESNPLEPASGSTTNVGVGINTHVAHSGTETFTVHVEYEDDLEQPTTVSLWDLEVEPRTVETGDTVQVNATYRNDGDSTKTVTSKLTVEGTVVDTQEFELRPGERKTITFERQMQWPGTFNVGVDGTDSERVTVTGPPIEVLESSAITTEITRGDTARVDATVRNPTDTPVDRTLELSVDGIVVDTRTVTIGPQSELTVTFERQFDEAGTYEIGVSGVSAGTITVSEPSFEIRDRELSAATTAALAPPMAMGLLFLGVAANRRWAVVPFR